MKTFVFPAGWILLGVRRSCRPLGRTFRRVQADHLAITEAIAHRQTSTFILSGNPTSPVYLDFNVSAFMRKPSATWKRANLKSTHCKKLTKSGLIRNVFKSGSISRCFMTFSHEVCIPSPALLSLQNDKCPRASLKYLHHFNLLIFLAAIKFDHFTEQTCSLMSADQFPLLPESGWTPSTWNMFFLVPDDCVFYP